MARNQPFGDSFIIIKSFLKGRILPFHNGRNVLQAQQGKRHLSVRHKTNLQTLHFWQQVVVKRSWQPNCRQRNRKRVALPRMQSLLLGSAQHSQGQRCLPTISLGSSVWKWQVLRANVLVLVVWLHLAPPKGLLPSSQIFEKLYQRPCALQRWVGQNFLDCGLVDDHAGPLLQDN